MSQTDKSIIPFPCEFPVKAMGRVDVGLEQILFNIVREFDAELSADKMHVQPSPQGKYISVTLSINAVSQDQLDSIYKAVTACEFVLFAL